jgi:hypothetical protein
MNRDHIIRMAREAGWGGDCAEAWADGYEAGAAAEREECAKVCDAYIAQGIGREMADAIRARGNHD